MGGCLVRKGLDGVGGQGGQGGREQVPQNPMGRWAVDAAVGALLSPLDASGALLVKNPLSAPD